MKSEIKICEDEAKKSCESKIYQIQQERTFLAITPLLEEKQRELEEVVDRQFGQQAKSSLF